MSKENFLVYYDGNALAKGLMEVRELAPALLSLGKLFEESNRVFNGDRASISVRVKSGFETGSFGISIEIYQSISTHAIDLFKKEPITTAAALATILGFLGASAKGLLWLIKKTEGKKPDKVIQMQNGNTLLDLGSNNKIEITQNVFNVYKDINVRKQLKNVIEPLKKEGIDSFKTKYKGEIVETIKKK